ncbi:hypothetical protein L3Q67_26190 [Saccharothrix sp. AJ9571]|nr:hypothetical protein L3Q67_26190 [Saccharothrix sp. AJ9571]
MEQTLPRRIRGDCRMAAASTPRPQLAISTGLLPAKVHLRDPATGRRLTQRADHRHAALIQLKNAVYAWPQALFLLSFCQPAAQLAHAERLTDQARGTALEPAADGLLHVLHGGGCSRAFRRRVVAGPG